MVRATTFSSLAALLASASGVTAVYNLVDNYDNHNFFTEGFNFFDGKDPTNGFVRYASAAVADANQLAGYAEGAVYLGVDYKSAAPNQRPSVRVTSNKAYTKGLFVADIAHMPVGCGVWPAFWTFGPGWPNSGEIDILEGVNSQTTNLMTLHTGPGCTVSQQGAAATTFLKGNDCGADQGRMGCPQSSSDAATYGPGFNAAGGGVYAMEWTSQAISVWFFARGSPQAALLGGRNATATPDVANFGTPLARFVGCDFDAHFKDHNLIFNTALCGDWAGAPAVWDADATCKPKAATCQQFVAENPSAFEEAYWLINSVRVYEQGGAAPGKKERRFRA